MQPKPSIRYRPIGQNIINYSSTQQKKRYFIYLGVFFICLILVAVLASKSDSSDSYNVQSSQDQSESNDIIGQSSSSSFTPDNDTKNKDQLLQQSEGQSFIVMFKDGTSVDDIHKTADYMKSQFSAKITNFYDIILGFSYVIPPANQSSLASDDIGIKSMNYLQTLQEVQSVEKDQVMSVL